MDRTLAQGTGLCPPSSLALGAQSSGGSSPLPLCLGQAVSGRLQQPPWKDGFGTPCFPFRAAAGIQTRGCYSSTLCKQKPQKTSRENGLLVLRLLERGSRCSSSQDVLHHPAHRIPCPVRKPGSPCVYQDAFSTSPVLQPGVRGCCLRWARAQDPPRRAACPRC